MTTTIWFDSSTKIGLTRFIGVSLSVPLGVEGEILPALDPPELGWLLGLCPNRFDDLLFGGSAESKPLPGGA